MGTKPIRKFHSTKFYEASVPKHIRQFITKKEFYSNMEAIIIEATQEGCKFSPLQRKLQRLRFVYGDSIHDISVMMGLTRQQIMDEYDAIANNISHYLENHVSGYPLKIIAFKMPQLNRNIYIKRLIRSTVKEKLTVKKFMTFIQNDMLGKNTNNLFALHVAVARSSSDKSSQTKEYTEFAHLAYIKLYEILDNMENKEEFFKLVSTKEKTKITTLTNLNTKIDDVRNKKETE